MKFKSHAQRKTVMAKLNSNRNRDNLHLSTVKPKPKLNAVQHSCEYCDEIGIKEDNKKISAKKEITKEEFNAYERVRVGGRTNMFMTSNVSALSGLKKEKIISIMENYDSLKKKYSK